MGLGHRIVTFAMVALFAVLADCVADTTRDAAELINDSSVWIMRGLPPALMLGGGEDEERIGRRMADAGVASQIASEALKALIEADRPDDPSATDGFPSGHAAAAWALAEAASAEEPSLRPYAYVFAAAATWSRVEMERHSVLQAVAGAALGYAIGHASARTHHGLFNGLLVREKAGETASASFIDGRRPTGFGRSASGTAARPVITLWQTTW
jgi:hypothetical protein